MKLARLWGRVARVPRSSGVPFLLGGIGFGWSGRVRHRVDALPGGGNLVCPGQAPAILGVLQRPPRTRRGGGVQEAGAQRLRLGSGQVTVQCGQLELGQKDARSSPHPARPSWPCSHARGMPEPGVNRCGGCPRRGCCGRGGRRRRGRGGRRRRTGPPAPRAGGPVRRPQRVAPPAAVSKRERCAPGCGRSRLAKIRSAFGQPFSRSPTLVPGR
jgi:hypothetical protein